MTKANGVVVIESRLLYLVNMLRCLMTKDEKYKKKKTSKFVLLFVENAQLSESR